MALTKEELAALQKMMTKAAEEIEGKLAASLDKAIEGINSKVDTNTGAAAELIEKAKTAVTTMPNLIQEKIDVQLKTNLEGMVKREWKAHRKE